MDIICVDELRQGLIFVSERIVQSEGVLTEIDTKIGDGDHGYGMKAGFSAVKSLLEKSKFTEVSELFKETGIELLRTMGGASGVIFGTMFTAGVSGLPSGSAIHADDLILFFEHGAEAISRRGRSHAGDKTMLDALLTAVETMKSERKVTSDITRILGAAAKGAHQGMEATKNMVAKKGRAKNFKTDTLGYPDAGAVSVTIIFDALAEKIQQMDNKIG